MVFRFNEFLASPDNGTHLSQVWFEENLLGVCVFVILG